MHTFEKGDGTQTMNPRDKAAIEAGTVYLTHTRIFGAIAWVLLDRCHLPPAGHPSDDQGILVTLPGEHSYFRDTEEWLQALERHGLTTVPGTSAVQFKVSA